MSGYAYGSKEPTENCPYCNSECDADFVDVGIGYTQCGPFHCQECGASEIGPNDNPRPLTADEERTGWYAPDSKPGSSANVIGGNIVSHKEMESAYKEEFTGNILWEDKEYVDKWYESIHEFEKKG